MTAREQLIEKAARALSEHEGDGCFDRLDEWQATHADERQECNRPGSDEEDADWYRRHVTAVLDAILPQVSTVAELEAYDPESVLVSPVGAYTRVLYADENDFNTGPLTVVWQPEVTA